MSTIRKISGSAALIALVLSLPVAAEQQVSSKFQEHTGLQPVSNTQKMPVRASDAPQSTTIEAALPNPSKPEPMSSPDNMPYITYDGADNGAR